MDTYRLIAGGLKKTLRLGAAALLMACIFSVPAQAEERQYKLEAAFLYSFFNYITWPGVSTPQQLQKPVVCVYGSDPILPYLNYMRDKMAGERTLTIREVNDADETTGCNILFIRHRMSPQMTSNIPSDTLVVFKPDDPLDRGGLIELAEDGERIAIRINQSQLEQDGFQISSRLLDLAQRGR